jgi:hypothetical protein
MILFFSGLICASSPLHGVLVGIFMTLTTMKRDILITGALLGLGFMVSCSLFMPVPSGDGSWWHLGMHVGVVSQANHDDDDELPFLFFQVLAASYSLFFIALSGQRRSGHGVDCGPCITTRYTCGTSEQGRRTIPASELYCTFVFTLA